MVLGGRKEGGSGWGTRVYLWWIHVDIWQNLYNIVKLKNKKKYMEFRKMITTTLYARQQKRHRCIEQSFDSVGEGEGGMILENGIESCIISYVK